MKSKRYISRIATVILLFSTAGCANMSDVEVGRMVGAIGGAIIGSEMSGGDRDAMTIGGLLGAWIGGEVAADLSDEDYALMDGVVVLVLNSGHEGHSRSWRNHHNRHYGSFTAHSTWHHPRRGTCRRYTNTVYTSHHPRRTHGTACRQHGGSWSIVH